MRYSLCFCSFDVRNIRLAANCRQKCDEMMFFLTIKVQNAVGQVWTGNGLEYLCEIPPRETFASLSADALPP